MFTWLPVVLGAGNVVLGFALGFGIDWFRRKRMRTAHWGILRAEISICSKKATWYLNRKVNAPLYRLPISAFGVSFPILVSEGDVTPEEFTSLIEYYSWAEDINRGLENAAEAVREADSTRLKQESERIHSKCEKLLSDYLAPVLKTLGNHDASPVEAVQPTGVAPRQL